MTTPLRKVWKTQTCTGVTLQGLLQQMTDDGLEVEYVFEHGVAPISTGQILGPEKGTIAAMFTVVAYRMIPEDEYLAALAARVRRVDGN